ncbi:MAG: AraC family transcriptional regulator [Cyclobacteriaceae bacterium]
MDNQKLYIKNMVCDRCKMVVKQELDRFGIDIDSIQLGEVKLRHSIGEDTKGKLKDSLHYLGFELLDDQKSQLISQIKGLIIDLVHRAKEKNIKVKYSVFISREVGKDYAYLSNLFSEIEGTTIEQYIIHQKIERAKELLVYGEMNISEIATSLNYSSVAHLSNQFKKVTGLTPTHFKTMGLDRRKPLDKV